jgi:hypothetical protein
MRRTRRTRSKSKMSRADAAMDAIEKEVAVLLADSHDDDVGEALAIFLSTVPSEPRLVPERRKRGRPATGPAKAWIYTCQVRELRRSGIKPWSAVKEVAKQNRKRPEHISACSKMVRDVEEHVAIRRGDYDSPRDE